MTAKTVKENQVWQMRSGQTVLIVKQYNSPNLKILFFDDGKWVVDDLLDTDFLYQLLDMTDTQFFNQIDKENTLTEQQKDEAHSDEWLNNAMNTPQPHRRLMWGDSDSELLAEWLY